MYTLKSFSHIYIEDNVKYDKNTLDIISKFPHANIIYIKHYKDIFNRSYNNFQLQKDSQKLILAKKHNSYLYPISKMIQGQKEDVFFYSSFVLNCIYNCQYCFLQGMYPSSYIVIFVNYDDFINAIIEKYYELNKSMFLSISYDSDLLVFEKKLNIIDKISYELKDLPITLEIRTKSANYNLMKDIRYKKNILLNFSLSPDFIINRYELKTPSLQKRLNIINLAIEEFCVAITFDPLIHSDSFDEIYKEFFDVVNKNIKLSSIDRFIVGVFRINTKQLKKIRKKSLSDIIHYSYESIEQVSTYNKDIQEYMINKVYSYLSDIKNDKIFLLDS
jgi:spore photoproduct lyase